MGSTLRLLKCRHYCKNHPHIHGEYELTIIILVCYLESSPYTWGVQQGDLLNGKSKRIIPIYMGSTIPLSSNAPLIENHPHIHGEY